MAGSIRVSDIGFCNKMFCYDCFLSVCERDIVGKLYGVSGLLEFRVQNFHLNPELLGDVEHMRPKEFAVLLRREGQVVPDRDSGNESDEEGERTAPKKRGRSKKMLLLEAPVAERKKAKDSVIQNQEPVDESGSNMEMDTADGPEAEAEAGVEAEPNAKEIADAEKKRKVAERLAELKDLRVPEEKRAIQGIPAELMDALWTSPVADGVKFKYSDDIQNTRRMLANMTSVVKSADAFQIIKLSRTDNQKYALRSRINRQALNADFGKLYPEIFETSDSFKRYKMVGEVLCLAESKGYLKSLGESFLSLSIAFLTLSLPFVSFAAYETTFNWMHKNSRLLLECLSDMDDVAIANDAYQLDVDGLCVMREFFAEEMTNSVVEKLTNVPKEKFNPIFNEKRVEEMEEDGGDMKRFQILFEELTGDDEIAAC